MTDSPNEAIAYAYELLDPFRPVDPVHPDRGAGTVWFDQPLRVGDRMRRAFMDWPKQEWEVVAIEPTQRDGQHASLRGYPLPGKKMPIPIMQGRLTLRPLG